jgi:hypothetical protein
VPLLLLVLTAWSGGCKATPPGHFYNTSGKALREMDHLWEEVDTVFPGALPERVKLVWVGGLHSSFMIDENAIGIPSNMMSHIRRGKICRMLTHLALHRLSGGGPSAPGRCFDNDVVFLEQAIAGYMDRKAAGLIDVEKVEATRLAAEMFRDKSMSEADLRDWEAFYYRGYWSDQFTEWNLEGLRALFSLGEYLERSYGISRFGPVFEALDDEEESLDHAVQEIMGMSLKEMLKAWKEEVLASMPAEADEQGAEGPPAAPEESD